MTKVPGKVCALTLTLFHVGAGFAQEQITSGPFLQCVVCHSTKAQEPHLAGPNLFGVYGAPIASKKGFVFSKALAAHKGTWTDDELQKWLQSPQTYAPGTKMAFAGVKDPEARRQVIETLKALH